jgi:hypothetical protein
VRQTLTFHRIFLKLTFCLAALMLKAMLDEFYMLFSKDFAYYGMVFNPVAQEEYLFSFLAVGLVAACLKLNHIKPSSVIWTLLFIFCFIPAATVFSMNAGHPAEGFYGLFISFLIVSLLLCIRFFPKSEFTVYLKMDEFRFWLVFIFSLLLFFTVLYYGLMLRWVSFSEVYDVRTEYAEQGNRFIGYFYGWLSHVLNIALLLIALNKSNYRLAAVALTIQVYLYTLGGHKSVLLLIPFLLWIYFGARYAAQYFSLYLIVSLLIIFGVLLLYDLQNGQYSDISSVAIRRNLLLPAQIYFHYVEYFSRYYSDYFAQNFPFSLFYESQYNEKLPALIGKNYFTFKEGIYANGNIFADLFANLGVWSFSVGSVLIAFVLKMFDKVAKDRNTLFVIPLAAISVVSLSNSGFIVNLVTHGLLLMMLLMALYPKTIFTLKFFKKKELA